MPSTPQSPSLRAYLRLLHFGPSVLTTAAFAAFILILARGVPDVGRLGLLLAAQLVAQFTISLANDYWDAPYDAQAQPDKPIPAGVIGRDAVGWLALLGAGATLALAVPLGLAVLGFTAVGLGAGLLYDAGLKRTLFSPLPFMIGFGSLPLWAAAGVGAPLSGPALPCAALTAVAVVALHLADTLPDLIGDTAAGVRGLAHRLGVERTITLCWAALAFGLALALGLALTWPMNWAIFVPVLALTTILLGAAIVLYRRGGRTALPRMSGLIEAAALLLPLGWLAGAVL